MWCFNIKSLVCCINKYAGKPVLVDPAIFTSVEVLKIYVFFPVFDTCLSTGRCPSELQSCVRLYGQENCVCHDGGYLQYPIAGKCQGQDSLTC